MKCNLDFQIKGIIKSRTRDRKGCCIIISVVFIIFIVFFRIIEVAATSTEHIVVHINAATVSDCVSEPFTEYFLRHVVGEAELEEAGLGCRESVIRLQTLGEKSVALMHNLKVEGRRG